VSVAPTQPVTAGSTTLPQPIPAESTIEPPSSGTAVAIMIPPATPADISQLLPTPTPTSIPTETPVPLPTATPTTIPTPFVEVQSGLASLRSGPGVEYPLVAQLGPSIPVAIVGQNPEGTWYQICCVNGQSVWVAKGHVNAVNDLVSVQLVLAEAPPTVTPTATATETPTVTPTPSATPYPFMLAEGPAFFATGNELLSIWVKVFAPMGDGQAPLPGYFLKVQFRRSTEGSAFEDRPNTRGESPSKDQFEFNVAPGPGSGNRVEYNYKFEFMAPDPKASNPTTTDTRATLIDGYWRVYLTDGSGTQLSDLVQFDTLAGNVNREVYIAWALTR
jgi:hypothetical protein